MTDQPAAPELSDDNGQSGVGDQLALEHPAAGDRPVDADGDAALPSPEVTLEFCLPPSEAGRLSRARALAGLRVARPRASRIRITWHDAPDGSLAAAGRVLLHIAEGGRSVWEVHQTVRDGSLAWPLGTPAPLLEAAVERPWPPLAVLDGHRRSLMQSSAGGITEVTLLRGTLALAAVSLEVARLSLRGAPEAVFALARALLDELPLSVPACSLSGEVRELWHGRSAPPPPVLHEALSVDDAIAHVVSQLTAAIAHHAPGARAGEGPEPVHQMRVALRRLRSALSLFRRVASGPEIDAARRDLAVLARALGPARDWDVFLSGTGRQVAKLLPDDPAVRRLLAAARRRHEAAYAALAEVLDGPGFQRTLLGLVELAVIRPWQRDAGPERPAPERPVLVAFARHALDRKRRRLTEAPEDLSPLADAELHAVRISCKRLRYAAEFFAPLAPGRQSRRFLRRLAAVQERLGHLNDGAVASQLLGELRQHGFAAGVVRGYLAARTAGGRAKAERSWQKFRRTTPFWE